MIRKLLLFLIMLALFNLNISVPMCSAEKKIPSKTPAAKADSNKKEIDHDFILSLTKKAEEGDAAAQYKLGITTELGQDVPQNYQLACQWFKKAAEQGDVKAQHNLGWMYVRGQGVPQDFKEACKWFRKAAKQGNAAAQYTLGLMLSTGLASPEDQIEAGKWFLQASQQGHTAAQLGLAMMYLNGESVPQSYTEVMRDPHHRHPQLLL